MPRDVQLSVNGANYGGWKSMRVSRGIEQLAGTFDLGVTDLWPGEKIVKEIAPGDECTVAINGVVVITGHVDDVAPSYDASTHEVTVAGRDATGDLVDCSAIYQTGQFTGKKAKAIVEQIVAPFGISVSADVDQASSIVDIIRLGLQGGETVHEVLDRIAKWKAVLMMSDGKGGLLITGPGKAGRVPVTLERGVNILASRLNFSYRERFSKVTVKGQGPSDDQLWGAGTRLKAEASDTGVQRYRPLVVIADELVDDADLRRRATWETNTRAGRSVQLAVKVQGWSYGEALWQPNTIVHVKDPWVRADADFLVKNVTFTLDESGSVTELALTPQQTFALIPMPKKPADAWDILSKQGRDIDKLKRDAARSEKQ